MQRSSFFNAELAEGQQDRVYLAEDFARYFGSFIGNGVFPSPSTNLQVLALSEDMSVTVKAGKAWINGYFYENTDDYILIVDNADGVLNRIDRVVVRLSHIDRKITLRVLRGVPTTTPVAPALTRNADVYELCIAELRVNKGITQIVQAGITDTRLDTGVCGIVKGTVSQIDTTTLFAQYNDWFNSMTQSSQQEFMQWFDQIRGVLDEETAGNLLNLINTTSDMINNHINATSDMINNHTANADIHTTPQQKVIHLAHTKSGTVHTLTGLPTTSGLYVAQFKATADFVQGNTFAGGYAAKPNGEDAALPDKAFVNGDLVSVVVDVAGKKLGFKLGGGTLKPKIYVQTAAPSSPLNGDFWVVASGYSLDTVVVDTTQPSSLSGDALFLLNIPTTNILHLISTKNYSIKTCVYLGQVYRAGTWQSATVYMRVAGVWINITPNSNRLFGCYSGGIYKLDPDTLVISGQVAGPAQYMDYIDGIQNRLYASNNASDRIYELNPATLSAIKTSPSPGGAQVYGIGGTQSLLFHIGLNTVYRLDPTTLSAVATYSVSGSDIGGINNRLYIRNGGDITELNTSTLSAIKTVNVHNTQSGGIGGMQTRLYSTTWYSNAHRMYELNPSTLTIIKQAGDTASGMYKGIGGTK